MSRELGTHRESWREGMLEGETGKRERHTQGERNREGAPGWSPARGWENFKLLKT